MLQRLRHAVGWSSAPAPSQTRVDFQVSAKLGHGEKLFVVGDVPPLGGSIDVKPYSLNAPHSSHTTPSSTSNSSSSDGLELVTTPELYPVWYNVEPIVLPCKKTIHYRYAVCVGGVFVRYENIPHPRSLEVKGLEMSTQDTLDELDTDHLEDKRYAVPIIPRLVSGQAFVDRRMASSSMNENEGSVRRGIRRGVQAGMSPRRMHSTILEEEENSDADRSSLELRADSDLLELTKSQTDSDSASVTTTAHGKDKKSALKINPAAASLDASVPVDTYSPMIVKRRRSISEEAFEEMTIKSTDGVIITSNKLPVFVSKDSNGDWVIEWDEDHLLSPKKYKSSIKDSFPGRSDIEDLRIMWVGTVDSSAPIRKEEEESCARALAAFHCVPVFLEEEMASIFLSYSVGTLWPVFHNVVDVYGALPTRWWNPTQQKVAWSMYTDANRIFVNKVIEVYNEGDLVWVHGLHLLLAPSFLSRRLPRANVGLYLHTPFPSSEIFRTLSVRDEVLRGMLSADHIGFHLYEYARHFLTSCRRILGLTYYTLPGGVLGVEYSGRIVSVSISHIGIEPQVIEYDFCNSSVERKVAELREKHKTDGKTVIVSIDYIERLKGIPLKLLCIEDILATYPELRDKIRVIQVGVENRTMGNVVPKKKIQEKVRGEIQELVDRINSKFKTKDGIPIVSYSEVERTQLIDRIPFWVIGDILFVTTIREAVNLTPFEFIYTHKLANKLGVVVLSEFSGSSRVLTGCVGINPWKRDEVMSAVYGAITMSKEEKQARHNKDLEYMMENTRTKWAERVLIDLKRAGRKITEGEFMGYGLGLNFRMLEFNAGFKALEVDQVARGYRTSFRRVLLFDFGCTLVTEENTDPFRKYYNTNSELQLTGDDPESDLSSLPAVPQHVISSLTSLCSDPRNTVFVVSGKNKPYLETLLGKVPGLGLAAEHGYLYRWGSLNNSKEGNREEWLCTKENYDDSWKDLTHAVMDIYTQRTHGTYIEIKGSSLIWQYRDGDPEFSQLQAKELHDQLTQMLEHFPVEMLMGEDYLEVRPEGVDKGAIVDRIISTIESSSDNYVDFILCVGDDLSDEYMFSYLEENRPLPKLFTCTVGKKPSAAKFFLNDVEGVHEVLNALTKVSTTSNRNFSMNDLHSFNMTTPTSDTNTSSLSGGVSMSNSHSLKSAKYSMSMMSLSSAADMNTSSRFNSPPTTLEQYFSNLEDDQGDDDEGGIFF